MSRATTLNLTPAGEAVGTTLVLVAVLLAEAAIDRWAAQPATAPTVDVNDCVAVCQGWVDRYSITECVCKYAAKEEP